MSVMHDYKCDLHGFFEAWEPVCPHGCTEGPELSKEASCDAAPSKARSV